MVDPQIESVPSKQNKSMLQLLFRGKMTSAKIGCSVVTFLLRKTFSGLWNGLRDVINRLSLFSLFSHRSVSRWLAVLGCSCTHLKPVQPSLPRENYQQHDMCRIPGGRKRLLPGETPASPFPCVSVLPFASRRGHHIRGICYPHCTGMYECCDFLNNSRHLACKLLIEWGWIFSPLN